jgi:hypothetical protein
MNFKSKAVSIFAAGIMALSMGVGASAQTLQSPNEVPVDVTVGSPSDAGISWTITVTSPWPTVVSNLDEAQATTGTFAVTVTDNRFNLRGWSFSIAADDFQGEDPANTATIPVSNFRADSGEVTAISANAGTMPVANDFVMSTTPQTLISAAPGTGSGRYQTTVAGIITIPANTPADTYETTIQITMNAAP